MQMNNEYEMVIFQFASFVTCVMIFFCCTHDMTASVTHEFTLEYHMILFLEQKFVAKRNTYKTFLTSIHYIAVAGSDCVVLKREGMHVSA